MWVGVLLVAGSVVVGARLFAAADDTVTVWAMSQQRGAGTPLAGEDLVATRVHFNDRETLERYFSADKPAPVDVVLNRTVGPGELLARTAVEARDEQKVVQVPLAVEPQQVPPDVRSGSMVDVLVSDRTTSAATESRKSDLATGKDGTGQASAPALSGVTVVAAPAFDDSFAVSGTRQIVVVVPESAAADFEALLGGLQDPLIRVLQRS
ncbi:MAG: hypothetical protein L0H31_06480 [Nocardioidaceae bacterium]|nr:hypothetical protein [Nocardioidaceae bacterium]